MYHLENQLKNLMLTNVEFVIDGKIIKRGKIKVFNTKQFFLKFKLDHCGDHKEYELPYPYRVDKLSNGFMFDYCLSAFIPKTEESYWKLKTLNHSECSKLFESHLYILKLSA